MEVAIKYNLTDNKSIYSKENLGKLEKDFKNENFKLKNQMYQNTKDICANRFIKEEKAIVDAYKKGYDEEQLNSDSTGFRINFFKRTLIPILLTPNDEALRISQDKKINVNSSRDINLESKDYLDGKTNWKNIFDEDDYYEKLAKQYEEERKKLEKKSDKSKDHNDYEGYEYGENALGNTEDEFRIASENFMDNRTVELDHNENEDDEYIENVENESFDKIKVDFGDGVISKNGLKELSEIVNRVNTALLSEKSGFSGFLEKAGYSIEKGWNFLSSSKFANLFRSEEKIKNTYLPPIDGIGRFLDKNKKNLTNFIEERKKYLSSIKYKQDDEIFQKEYNQKSMGLLRVKKYATMMLINIIKESINLSRYKEKDREKYKNDELSILLFKIYKRAWEDYNKLKSEYDDVKQSKSNSRNHEYENKDDEKKKEVKKQDNDEKFEVANYLKMFKNDKIANYLVMRVRMRLIEIYLKTNFFGFDTNFDNEEDEKNFEFKKKYVISIIDKQSNLKYTAKQVSDILDKDKNSGEYKNLENYFDILIENLKISMGNFKKLGKKWIDSDSDANIKNVKKIQKDFPIGGDFDKRTNLEFLKKTFENKSDFSNFRLNIYERCFSFGKNDFDKALKKAEEIRATYGIS